MGLGPAPSNPEAGLPTPQGPRSSPSRGLPGLRYLRLGRLGSVFSSDTCRGGRECGRAAQTRAETETPGIAHRGGGGEVLQAPA